jgi:predicted DNA binding CopG/RHH family protein
MRFAEHPPCHLSIVMAGLDPAIHAVTLRTARNPVLDEATMAAERRPAMKNAKRTPRFRNEAEERKFWETHDSTDYVDWSTAQRARFPNLKPSTKSISLRLPLSLLEQIKVEANKRDVPYQSLIKVWLAEKVS